MALDTRQLDSGVNLVTISRRLALGGETEKLDTVISDLLATDQKRFIFDLAGLDYVDSSGIGMLVACLTKIKKAGGELKVAGANPRVRRIFSMTGVEDVLPMFESVAAATT